ncbi:MAG: hypothetical protein JW804_00335 [Sedimentisphaerales bacterium]|nr:hypothetical protein [Sedimentisphaerales bacterium]
MTRSVVKSPERQKLLILVILCNLTLCAYAKYSGGTGEPNDPYLISTPEDLNAIGDEPNDLSKHFKMTADINMAGYSYTTSVIAPDTSSSSGFQGTIFRGVFDGNGRTIFSLVINGSNNDYLGLFGQLGQGSNIKNLKIENVNITGDDILGVLCGNNQGGNISNCYATGSVTSGESSYVTGGLCGGNGSYGTISNCYATVSVNGGNNSLGLGGLCGDNYNGTISNCYATGSVTGGSNSQILGGLCGKNNGGTISNCYSTGSITGGNHSFHLGGLCGRNDGEVSNCFSTGPVISGDSSDNLGGLCGWNYIGIISNCYATGSITGGSVYVGGLCGRNHGTISNSYFLNPSDGGGPDNGFGEPLTDEQMKLKSSFVGWDFDTPIWEICTETVDYPHLWWEYYCNTAPVAVAGPNQTAYLCHGDKVEVTLDGSASYDDDNDVLDYYWSWTIDTESYEANGVSPTIELPAGEHIIKLVVNDGIEDSEPDYCTITVIPGINARLFMLPKALNPHARQRMCFAMLILPEGIKASDFDRREKLMLYPCELQSRYQFAFDIKRSHHSLTYILGVFDLRQICSLLGPGVSEVEVVGWLKDDRCFTGTDTIRIVPLKH